MPDHCSSSIESLQAALAPEDQAHLAVLPPVQVQEFSLKRAQVYRAKIQQLNGYIEELLKVHNAASPILRILPTELIVEIFRHIHPESRADIRLGHVCRTWRAILQDTPEFWAKLISIPEAAVRTEADWACYLALLTRSFPRPYGLFLDGHRLPLMADARRHVSRITSLVITFDARYVVDHLPDLAEFLALGLPCLEDLVVTISEFPHDLLEQVPPDYGVRYLTSRAAFPRLRTLRTNGSLFTTALACRSLLHVTLIGGEDVYTRTTYLTAHTFPILIEALRQCPQLETLELISALPRDPGVYVSVVHLESLRRLSIDDDTELVRAFLERVPLPATTNLQIHNVAPSWRSAYTEVLPRVPPLALLPHIDQMAVCFDYADLVWTLRACVGGEERLLVRTTWTYLGWEDITVLADLREVLILADMVDDLDLKVENMAAPADAEQWALLLPVLPSLTRLAVSVQDAEGLVEALAGVGSPVLVPYLEKLEIRSWMHEEDMRSKLASAMQARADAGYGPVSWSLVDGHPDWASDC